jgi:perosamine synthetase
MTDASISQSTQLPQQVVTAIRTVLGEGTALLHEPRFRGNELAYLKECIDSTYVSSVGKFVDRFEAELAEFTGAGYAVAVVNGTAALHIALHLAGVKEGDEVLLPSLTFIATANAVAYCNAIPHFVDSSEKTLGIDPEALRDYLKSITEMRAGLCINKSSGRVIRAIVPMHAFGHPVDMRQLLSVTDDFNILVIEDAAESLGSTIGERHTGTFGLMGTLSFNGNKTITTGGGGAILTSDKEIAVRAKHLTTTAKVPHRWNFVHDEIAYNYRLPNLNAALGCAQLEQMPAFLVEKRNLFNAYLKAFSTIEGISLFSEPEGCTSNYWLQTLLLDKDTIAQRDAILTATNDVGLMTRPAWTLMHYLPIYQKCPRAPLPVAERLEKRLINIPSSAGLVTIPNG